jgi:hypothetical protein
MLQLATNTVVTIRAINNGYMVEISTPDGSGGFSTTEHFVKKPGHANKFVKEAFINAPIQTQAF